MLKKLLRKLSYKATLLRKYKYTIKYINKNRNIHLFIDVPYFTVCAFDKY